MRKGFSSYALLSGLVLSGFLALCGTAAAVVPEEEKNVAVLRALDKITARVETLEITRDQPFKFGTLIITLRSCRVTPPEETPEAAAFLDIVDFKPGEDVASVFRGWMFASSPALSALEHPIYDLWLIGCEGVTQRSTAPQRPARPEDQIIREEIPAQ